MKAQCDDHGCSELLCGCNIDVLESNADFCEQIRAKNKWIDKLLKENEELKGGLIKFASFTTCN